MTDPIECRSCGHVFASEAELDQDRAQHHALPAHRCPWCSYNLDGSNDDQCQCVARLSGCRCTRPAVAGGLCTNCMTGSHRAAAERVRELAEKATPGPWSYEDIRPYTDDPRSQHVCAAFDAGEDHGAIECGVVDTESAADAQWIATMSPAIAKPLVDLLTWATGIYEGENVYLQHEIGGVLRAHREVRSELDHHLRTYHPRLRHLRRGAQR